MGELIDAMLLLSELTRRELSPTRVDLSTIAREISEELRSRDPSREVEVVLEDGLEVVADPQLVRVLLGNLLENGLLAGLSGSCPVRLGACRASRPR